VVASKGIEMKKVLLKRLKSSATQGTLGIVYIDGNECCQSLELPWNNNLPNCSCIPTGKYICKLINSPSKGQCFEITNVRDRDHILIHSGNYLRSSLGCVLLGSTSGEENNQFVVYNSRNAVKRFMEILGECDIFELEII
jgi:hypothetical protein